MAGAVAVGAGAGVVAVAVGMGAGVVAVGVAVSVGAAEVDAGGMTAAEAMAAGTVMETAIAAMAPRILMIFIWGSLSAGSRGGGWERSHSRGYRDGRS